MSIGVNKVILVGCLGKDPELKFTPSGQAVCNFSLATSESFKDKNGEKQSKTEWHNIVIWGKPAEIANQYLKKGSQVYLEGKITTRSWDDKEGNKKYTTEIVVNSFQFLSGTKGNVLTCQITKDEGEQQQSQPVGSNTEDNSDLPF